MSEENCRSTENTYKRNFGGTKEMTSFMINGNITRDAETRLATTPNGAKMSVTDFSVAVHDGYGENEIVTYYKVTVWGDRGSNLCPYLKKGKEVNVKGIPGIEKPWQGEDGQLHNGNLRILRAEVELKGKKSEGAPEFAGEEVA